MFTAWPDLALCRLPTHFWAEEKERRGARASDTQPLRETELVLGIRTLDPGHSGSCL